MRIAILFSGGKDSTFALYWAIQQAWDVCCLVTLKSSKKDSWMFHTPNITWTSLQAKALGIPQIMHTTKGEKESELADLAAVLHKAKRQYRLDGLVVGAILSDYQQERVNRVCHDVGLKVFSPLWHKRQGHLLQEMIDCGFEIIIQSVAAEGMDKAWLGRRLDSGARSELLALQKKFGFHPAGEGGEFESFVLDGPIFKKRVVITDAEKKMEAPMTGVLVIKSAKLVDKISTIILDWGGVLAPSDTPVAAALLSKKYGCSMVRLKKRISEEEDKCSESEDYQPFLKRISKEFSIPPDEIVAALLNVPPHEGYETAKMLQGKAMLCLLSNQMHFKTLHIKKSYDLTFFDHVFFSSEIGVRKPKPAVFKYVLDKIGKVPEECLFIDDKKKNVEAAKKLGIHAVQCTTPEELRKALAKRGIFG